MNLLPPPGMARKITLATAALACLVILAGSFAAYLALRFMVEEQVSRSLRHGLDLVSVSVEDRLADAVGSLEDMAANRLIRNALIDNSGRENYLLPFLQGFRKVSDLSVSVAVTEFDGSPFADNAGETCSNPNMAWIAGVIASGESDVYLEQDGTHEHLVLAAPIFFPNTGLPEGGLVYHLHPQELFERAPLAQHRKWLSWVGRIELELFDPRTETGLKVATGTALPGALNMSRTFTGSGPLAPLTIHVHLHADPELLHVPMNRLLALIGIVGGAILLIVVPASRIVGQRLAARLNQLESSVAHVVSHGDTTIRFPVSGHDEVAQLAGAFNRMLERLDQAHRELDVRHQVELDHSEARFRTVLEHAGDAIYLIDADTGRILDGNGKAHESLGYTREELLALTVADFQPAAGSIRARTDPMLAPGQTTTMECLYRRKNGETFPVEVNVGLMEVGSQRFLLSVARDISERKRGEKIIRERAMILSQMSDALIVMDLGGGITDCNPAAERIVGYSAAEMLGRKLSSILGGADAAPAAVRSKLAFAVRYSRWSGELNIRHSNGTVATCEAVLLPFKDEAEQVIAVLGVFRDVTDKKLLEEELLQAQKMEAVGQLTGGIAHDFNNLLQVIFGNLELARRSLPGNQDRLRSYVDTAYEAGTRAADLTQQLLAFSRKQHLRPAPVDPNEGITRILKLLRRTLGERIDVHAELACDVPPILVDRSALESAIINLAINAKDAMPEGGRLTLVTRVLEGRGEGAPIGAPGPRGAVVRISVSDSGLGMPPEVRQRAFEPFYTTKPPGEGTGLGLATVYGFVKQSRGDITLECPPGHGTAVHMDFPALTTACPLTGAPDETAAFQDTSGTILVVEDEAEVRETVLTMVEACGFQAVEAEDAETALRLLRQRKDVRLLLTDLVLGRGADGYELAQAAHAIRSDLPVLLCTGYTERELAHTRAADGEFQLLRKPYTLQQLATTLQSLLHR